MPPQGPKNRDGVNCKATVIPTAVTDPESCSTIQSWAMRCIQMAMTAMKWPIAKIRKLGTFREMKVCRQGSFSLDDGEWLGDRVRPVCVRQGTGGRGIDDGLADVCR